MSIKHKCAYCGKEYETDTYYSKYCSDLCLKAAEEKRKQEYSKTKTRICKFCGKEFQVHKLANGNYSHAIYCSTECMNGGSKRSERGLPIKKCIICGKEFESTYSNGKAGYNKKYCSKECELVALNNYKEKYEANKTRICKVCGKEFQVPRITDGHFSETLFCSDKCRYLGRSRSQNSAQKQRELTCLQKYGVIYPCLTKQCRESNYNIISNTNKSFAENLNRHGIDYTEEFVLGNYAYDFKVKNILIEINPTYTHSTLGNHFNDYQIRPEFERYHKDKTDFAIQQGYRCINIWDWDNWDKIINQLTPKIKVSARDLAYKEVDKDTANLFLDQYHIQGRCKGNIVNLGLYNNGELIQIMTFGKPRYNKNYQWELLRLCSHKDFIITGGAERLFKHFITTYNPQSVLSYCDLSKFSGDVYLRLNFNILAQNKPQKIWSKGSAHITDNLLRQRGFDQLFKTNYGKGTNNEQLMIEHDWRPIYDCGQNTYVWKSPDTV